MDSVRLSINGMTCGHCVKSVREALAGVPGVEVEDVRIGSAELRLRGAHTETVLAAVQDAGYDATIDASTGTSTGTSVDASASAADQNDAAGCACCVPGAAPAPLTIARNA